MTLPSILFATQTRLEDIASGACPALQFVNLQRVQKDNSEPGRGNRDTREQSDKAMAIGLPLKNNASITMDKLRQILTSYLRYHLEDPRYEVPEGACR